MEIVKIYTDASIKEKIKIGIYIEFNGITLSSNKEYSKNLYDCNNNTCLAEIIGIDSALNFCLKEKYFKLFYNKKIIIHNDNLTAIRKMIFKNTKIGFKNIQKIENNLNSIITFKWIPRGKNKIADKLCIKYYNYYNFK